MDLCGCSTFCDLLVLVHYASHCCLKLFSTTKNGRSMRGNSFATATTSTRESFCKQRMQKQLSGDRLKVSALSGESAGVCA